MRVEERESADRNHRVVPYQRPEGKRDQRLLRRFGTEFRRCRLSAGLSQVELARQSGVSQSTISRIERGKASSAALLKLVRISMAMGSGFPLGFCPHPHFCSWNRLDVDGTHSRDPRKPVASEEYLEAVRSARTDRTQLWPCGSGTTAACRSSRDWRQPKPRPNTTGPADPRLCPC